MTKNLVNSQNTCLLFFVETSDSNFSFSLSTGLCEIDSSVVSGIFKGC